MNGKPKICLTIAGLDPSGGAGIVADIKTFTSFGCFAAAAVTSLTFQNTQGVFGAVHQTAETVRRQIEPVLQDYKVAAVKTGMIPTSETIEEIAKIVQQNKIKKLVVDPVVRSTSGFDLIDDKALKTLIEKLFPLAEIITPNIPEAERITKMKIESEADIFQAAKKIQGFGAKNVLIKGGHPLSSDIRLQISDYKNQRPKTKNQKSKVAKDFLFIGNKHQVFEAEWIETDATHGTGCTLAAAIAANLANGRNLIEAVEASKRFVTEAIRSAPNIGRGHSPVNHSVTDFRF